VPARLTLREQAACIAAFAIALCGTYAATAGGGEPGAEAPAGVRAVPLELPAAPPRGLSLEAAAPVPALADPASLPAPVSGPGSAPAPAPAPLPPPAPAPPPPAPAPVPAPAAPGPVPPDPSPVDFDDSG
jgi:hypothetical protein